MTVYSINNSFNSSITVSWMFGLISQCMFQCKLYDVNCTKFLEKGKHEGPPLTPALTLKPTTGVYYAKMFE